MKKLLLAMLVLLSAACGKDDPQTPDPTPPGPVGPPPVITSVKDPSGEVAHAKRGSTIEITGEHFSTLRAVKFNGTEADLATASITDTKILIVIPLAAPIISERAVEDRLEIVNTGGSVGCDFILLPDPPSIASVSNMTPEPGNQLTITGTGFYYVQNVSFPAVATPVEVTAFTVNPAATSITVTVPAGYDAAEGYVWVNALGGKSHIRTIDPTGRRLDITNLRYLNTSHGAAPWQVKYDLQASDRVYVDREYVFDFIPSYLCGSTWISTATNSRTFNTVGEPLASFDINREADVYVARNRANGTTVEEWLQDWTPMPQDGTNVITSSTDTFHLYKKTFPAGTVTLYRNGNTGRAPYVVIVK